MRKTTLKDLFSIEQGYAFKSSRYMKSGKYVLCTLGNISEDNNFKFNPSRANYYPDEFPRRFILEAGDLILPLTEQAVGLFGNSAFIPQTDEFYFVLNQRVGKIVPKSGVSKRYLHYLLSTGLVKQQIEATASGTSQRNTSPEKIYEVTVWVPSESAQESIGDFLFNIEEQINVNNQVNDNLQAMLQTLYGYWFLQFDFPDENGRPYRSSGGRMVWNDQLKREIPAGWRAVTLRELLKKNRKAFDYGTVEPTIDLSVMPTGSIALNNLSRSDAFSSNLYQMSEGDILFGAIRPYLKKAGIAPCNGVVAGTVHSFSPVRVDDYNFALATITSEQMFLHAVRSSTGTRMPTVKADDLLDVVVAYSESVATAFNQIPVARSIIERVQESSRLGELRNWLLPLLMNGQATVVSPDKLSFT